MCFRPAEDAVLATEAAPQLQNPKKEKAFTETTLHLQYRIR